MGHHAGAVEQPDVANDSGVPDVRAHQWRQALRADFPALEAVARAVPLGPQNAATEDRKTDVLTAAIDPAFLEDFRPPASSRASRPRRLSSDHSAIVSERTAERLFGTTQALGRRVLLQTRVEVTDHRRDCAHSPAVSHG